MWHKVTFWILFIASVFLFFLPISTPQAGGMGLDKIFHIFLFALLLFYWHKAYKKHLTLGFLVFVFYALAVELIQGFFLPYRSFELLDLIAGWIGLFITIAVLRTRMIVENKVK